MKLFERILDFYFIIAGIAKFTGSIFKKKFVNLDKSMTLTSPERLEFIKFLERAPVTTGIEPTNICNANCGFCAYGKVPTVKSVMDLELFKKVADDLAQMGESDFRFTPIVGDPLVDPAIYEKIRYVKQLGSFSKIYFYSNLIKINPSRIQKLLDAGVTDVHVSTCLGGRAMYKRVYGVDKGLKVYANIRCLLNSALHHSNKVNISILCRNEKPKWRAYLSLRHFLYLGLGGAVSFMWDDYDTWGDVINEKDLPKGNSLRIVGSKSEPCAQLYNGFTVDVAGRANLCWCRDFDGELAIGSVTDDSVSKVWQSSRLKEIRGNWGNGKIPSICERCTQYTSVYNHSGLVAKFKGAR